MSLLTLEAKLERLDPSTPWGFRMQGGKDFSSSLSIQRVNPGSLAAKCGLQTGDIILKIGNTDTSSLRHKEAQNSIIAAGNRLDLLLQRGGAPVRSVGNYETFSAPAISPGAIQNAGSYTAPQTLLVTSTKNYNVAPKPFGTQPAPYKPAFDDGLSQRTQNLSFSPTGSSDSSSSSQSVVSAIPATSSSTQLPPPSSDPKGFRTVAEKYAEMDEPAKPSQHQSRSFKYLQEVMDSGKEPPRALKTVHPPALQARSVSPAEDRSSRSVPVSKGPAQVIGSSKPGTVKAIVSQRYNTPIGLYSQDEVMTQFQGQSKFLYTPDQGEEGASDFPPPPLPPPPPEEDEPPLPSPPPPAVSVGARNGDSGGPVKYTPSETYKMVQEAELGSQDRDAGEDKLAHSRSFFMLQKQLDRWST